MTVLILCTEKRKEVRCLPAAQNLPCSICKNLAKRIVGMYAAKFDKGLFRISCCIRQCCIRRDERPAPNDRIDQPLVRAKTKGARHRAQIKIQKVGKFPLRRKFCMRQQPSAEDIAFELNGKRTIKRRMEPRACGTPRHRIIIERIDGHRTSPTTLSYIQFYC